MRNLLVSLLLTGLAVGAHAAPPLERTQTALAAFETSCLAQRWAQCHSAWYGLFDAGMKVKTDGSGDDTLSFPGQPAATAQYGIIAAKLDAPGLREGWNAAVLPLDEPKDARSAVLARLGLFDSSMKDAALDVVQERLKAKRVPYNVHAVLKNDRAEWLRYMTLVYLARDDQADARESLAMLAQSGDVRASEVQALRQAIARYFSR